MSTEIIKEPKVINYSFPFKMSVSRSDAVQIAGFLVKQGASFLVYYAGEKTGTDIRISQHAANLLEDAGVLDPDSDI